MSARECFCRLFLIAHISCWSSLDEKFSRKLISIVTSPEFFFCLLCLPFSPLSSNHSWNGDEEKRLKPRALGAQHCCDIIFLISLHSLYFSLLFSGEIEWDSAAAAADAPEGTLRPQSIALSTVNNSKSIKYNEQITFRWEVSLRSVLSSLDSMNID